MTFAPGAEMPASTVEGERFLFVMEGEVQERVAGGVVTLLAMPPEAPTGVSARMPVREFIDLEDGAETQVKPGPRGRGRSPSMHRFPGPTSGSAGWIDEYILDDTVRMSAATS